MIKSKFQSIYVVAAILLTIFACQDNTYAMKKKAMRFLQNRIQNTPNVFRGISSSSSLYNAPIDSQNRQANSSDKIKNLKKKKNFSSHFKNSTRINFKTENNEQEIALIKAATIGDIEQAEALLNSGADVNALVYQIAGVENALKAAVLNNHKDIVELFLNRGANVNSKYFFGTTALMYVNNKEIAQLLISKGVPVNVQDEHGKTALIEATQVYKEEVVQLLLDADAEVNAQDNDGRTALMFATHNVYPFYPIPRTSRIVKLLISKGANVNIKDKYGRTALMYTAMFNADLLSLNSRFDVAAAWYDTSCESLNLVFKEMAQALLEVGAEVNAVDNDGNSALMIAASNGNKEMVELLLQSGADANAKDNKGQPALHKAISRLLSFLQSLEKFYQRYDNQPKNEPNGLVHASWEPFKQRMMAHKPILDAYQKIVIEQYNSIIRILLNKELNK